MAIAASLLFQAPGCAPRAARDGPGLDPLAARARAASFHGWRGCGRLANALLSATVVPQVGGRTLEFALDGSNFLFIGGGELGSTFAAGDERRYRHFGGQSAQLHPEEKWARVQSRYPPELFMGRYELRLLPAEAGKAAVEVAGPMDIATGTRVVRRVELFSGSTRLRITDTLTNIRPIPQEWGIQAMLQLKGAPSASGVVRREDAPDGSLALYVPLNPKSRFKGGVRIVGGGSAPRGAETPRPQAQWSTAELPGLLALRYRREFSKALLDPALPWAAFADERAGNVFVQVCAVPEKVVIASGTGFAPYPFIELQCFGPVARLGPGESTSLVQEWFAARCPGPIVDVTSAGVVASPLSLLKGDGRTWVAGTFGVFHVGTAAVVFRGADGAELSRLDCGPVTPLHPLKLNRPIDLPPQAAQVDLQVRDTLGNSVGHLGMIALPSPR
ncbi:MAG: hypothetical protein FJ291_29370 [Planctomycetes bacterium]|nr:hypothetical protein [Planctomycetota bacterium]